MKNFNFAVLVAAYVFAAFWVFAKTQNMETFLIYAVAGSPMAVLAFAFQGRRISQKPADEMSDNAILAHILALIASVALIVFVLRAGERKEVMLFFGNITLGWTLADAFLMLFISLAMGVAALVVWTSYRFRETENLYFKNVLSHVFFAGASEKVRLLIYIYIFATAWSIGMAAVSLIWPELHIKLLILKMSRACLPFAVILVVAMIRLPFMGAGLLISCGTIWYLVYLNTDWAQATVFLGAPIVFFLCYFAISAFSVSSKNAVLASEAGTLDRSSQKKDDTEPAGGEVVDKPEEPKITKKDEEDVSGKEEENEV